MSNEARISEYAKDLSNSLVTSKYYSTISDSLKDVLSKEVYKWGKLFTCNSNFQFFM